MATLSKRSFAGGEIAPALHYRVDLSKYTTGVKTLRNFTVMRHGGATNRPGTQFVGEVSNSSRTVRLVPFVFNDEQTYVMEFGHYYLRLIQNGAHLKEAADTITGITQANPGVVTTSASHGYSDDDEVFISGVVGMTELNNRNFKVNVLTTTTFELQDMSGTNFDTTSLTAYSSGGTSEKIFTVETDYIEGDLPELQFVQSADVVTIVHPDYEPKELSRVAQLNWTFSDIVIEPTISRPASFDSPSSTFAATSGGAGSETFRYVVTAIKEDTFEESLPAFETSRVITSVSAAANAVITTTAVHGYVVGDTVHFDWFKNDVNTSNGPVATINNLGSGPFTIDTVPSTTTFTIGVNTSTGTNDTGLSALNVVRRPYAGLSSVAVPTSSAPHTLTWSTTTTPDAQEYNVYKEINGVFGLLGVAGDNTFEDIGVSPDTSSQPPIERDPFDASILTITNITQADPAVVTFSNTNTQDIGNYGNGTEIYILGVEGMTEVNNTKYLIQNLNTTARTFELRDADNNNIDSTGFTAYSSAGEFYLTGKYPSAVTFFQQRLTFANTDDEPEKVFASRTGRFKNFTISSPIQADDALTFTMAGREVNEIRHLLDLKKLILFTTSGEWTVEGDDSGILRPTSINPRQHSYNGSSTLSPIVINNNALYLQARGSYIRDLGFDIEVDGYRGNDLTIFSSHLFEDYTITDWAYQQIPNSVVWAVRSDGVLLSLTYVIEQQIFAWARHDFDGGTVENVAVVPEGSEDILYVVVKRTVDGSTKRYVERMNSRNIVDLVDSKFLDSYLTFDGRNTGSTTMTLSGGTDWTYLEDLTLTASAAFFESGDIGNQIHLKTSGGDVVRCTINAFTSSTVVTVKPHKTVPVALRSTATTNWSEAVDTVSGLWHLEGKSVSVFADKFVVANPNNDSYDTVTVSSGSVTLDKPYSVIHVGLPYTSDIETLDIDTPEGQTIVDRNKLVGKVTLGVEESRGGWIGSAAPDETVDFLDGLTEIKIRNDEDYDDPVALKTGTMDLIIRPEWNSTGKIFIRQTDPIPFTVLSIHAAGYYPFRG